MKQQPATKKSRLASYGKYSGIAFQMIALILIGVFSGIKLDEYLGSSPIFTIVLILLAVIMAMVIVIKGITK